MSRSIVQNQTRNGGRDAALRDEDNRGPAKTLAMRVMADGIDVNDSEAVDAWFQQQPDPKPLWFGRLDHGRVGFVAQPVERSTMP